MADIESKRNVSLSRAVSFGGAIILSAAVGWWGALETVTSRNDEPAPLQLTATATNGSIEQTLHLTAAVEQTYEQVASNGLSGTVTGVGDGQVSTGSVLYTVNDTSVRAIVGSIPFWRTLETGTKGADVVQLQNALIELGLSTSPADGVYGTATASAVRSWQAARGDRVSGVVALGEVVALPELPTSAMIDSGIILGGRLNGGEPAISVQSGAPRFELVLTYTQASQIPIGARVELTTGDALWEARVSGIEVGANDDVVVSLSSTTEGSICGDECSQLPGDGRTLVRADVEVLPTVSGVTIPIAAIEVGPTGGTSVSVVGVGPIEVSIVASSGGVAIVEGIELGAQVLLPSAESDKTKEATDS